MKTKMNLSKKQQFCKFPIFILGIVTLALSSCNYYLSEPAKLPNVITDAVLNIKETSAMSGGTVTDDGGAEISLKGVCWSTKVDPTIEDSISRDGTGIGWFSSKLRSLTPSTTYYVRAYAASSEGNIYYGRSIRFKTNETSSVSTELVVDSITATSAISGGFVIQNKSDSVTTRGVCWSTRINPSIKDSITISGKGGGRYVGKLRNLLPNTSYFIRAYATDSIGTVYGDAIGFVTSKLPIITTVANITNITFSSATSGGNVILDGGEIITERGICWSTTLKPTIKDSKSVDILGNGLGSFSCNLSNLDASTKYHVRAYATSKAGTAYGNDVLFTSGPPPTISDIDGNEYHTLTIGTQVWLVENLKTTKFNDGTAIPLVTDQTAWAGLATPGYCWYNNDANYKNSGYGALYNWYTVNTGKLAPTGWHVPTDSEWATLTNFVNSNGGKLKVTGYLYWYSPNTGATNETEFSALPSGIRGNNDGTFTSLGQNTYWWSSSIFDDSKVWLRSVNYNNGDVSRSTSSKINGFSVRCIRD